MFTWFAAVSPRERRTFWACFGGWALDALDMQMFSLVIPAIVAEWSLSRTQAGFVGGATLVASALGGWVAGMLSDRFGRVRTLQWTIACFSVGTFACAFATSYPQFVTLKTLQGIGFGGEWAAGAVLMAETIRAEHAARRWAPCRAHGRSAGGAPCCFMRSRSRCCPPSSHGARCSPSGCCRRC